MFTINDDLSIYATRGDTVFFTVTADENGTPYTFQAGDVLRIKIYEKKNAENVVLEKCFPVTAATTDFTILLTEEDTKIGEVISKAKDYWYEIELNPFTNPQTIIGFDEDGAKNFKLFPEGADSEIPEVKPEDIPVVDDELDMTSNRPVQNQAISRAIVNLEAAYKVTKEEVAEQANKTSDELANMKSELATERARIDNIVAMEEGSTTGDAELMDIRVCVGGVTCDSAGTAVRSQLNAKLDKNFTNIGTLMQLEYIESQYKNHQYGNIFSVDSPHVSTVVLRNVKPGERYALNSYKAITEMIHNYFVFESDTVGVGAIQSADITKYVQYVEDSLYQYIITIPEGCITFYTAVGVGRENDISIRKLEAFEIPALKMIPENFPIGCIPKSALPQEEKKILECISKPFDFSGKTVCAFGDSITHGVSSPNLQYINDNYIRLFAKKFGMTLTNRSVSGATLCEYWQDSSCTPIYQKVANEKGQYDFIIVSGGTNDFGTGRQLGTFGDTDVTTVYGALQNICDSLKENHPESVIIFISPINRTKAVPNSVATLDDYRKAIFEVATANGFDVVNGAELGLPSEPGGWNNLMIADTDGCHPTAMGHKLYFRNLCAKLA